MTVRFLVSVVVVPLLLHGDLLYGSCRGQPSHLNPNALYKIVDERAFDLLQCDGCLVPSTLDLHDGFVHASYGSQVAQIIEKFYRQEPSVFVLELNVEVLTRAGITVRPEAKRGEIFPHLYGAPSAQPTPPTIPLAAVANIIEVRQQK